MSRLSCYIIQSDLTQNYELFGLTCMKCDRVQFIRRLLTHPVMPTLSVASLTECKKASAGWHGTEKLIWTFLWNAKVISLSEYVSRSRHRYLSRWSLPSGIIRLSKRSLFRLANDRPTTGKKLRATFRRPDQHHTTPIVSHSRALHLTSITLSHRVMDDRQMLQLPAVAARHRMTLLIPFVFKCFETLQYKLPRSGFTHWKRSSRTYITCKSPRFHTDAPTRLSR